MPYEYILGNVLAENENAAGVLFLDDSGETVGVASSDLSPENMRLLGAYVGLYLRQTRRFLTKEVYGEVRWLQIEEQDMNVYGVPLVDGYYLVLAQHRPALTGLARRSLRKAADQLIRELFSDGKK